MKKLLSVLVLIALLPGAFGALAEAGEPAPADASAVDFPIDEVLDALGDPVYRETYEALQAGEAIGKGSKGDAAKGVQQALIALGQDITADGSIGPRTISALNAVQAAFGLPQTEALDAAGYAGLLPGLLIAADPDAADGLLREHMDAGRYDYLRGCALYAKGLYYSAKLSFEGSGFGDWEDRAAACVQPWPKTGPLYSNPDVKGSNCRLTVAFNTDEDIAMLVKIYTADGALARTLFIGGTGKASATLPAGFYVIKDGSGANWYGEEETFGGEGEYEVMTFVDGEQAVELMKNCAATLTVNVLESDPDADSLEAVSEDWGDF